MGFVGADGSVSLHCGCAFLPLEVAEEPKAILFTFSLVISSRSLKVPVRLSRELAIGTD
jgi:hypothetical protein